MYDETHEICTSIVNVKNVSGDISNLLDHLNSDMKAVALAAPQIGLDICIFAVRAGTTPSLSGVYINPEITWSSDKFTVELEACRSLPKAYALVNRPKSVKMRYIDIRGNEHERTYHGHAARIVQHEIDHLNGIMIDTKQERSDV